MDCYYHGYSGGPGGACNACEREDGPHAGYYQAKADLHKAQEAMAKRLTESKEDR
jgi:hypothetical protein